MIAPLAALWRAAPLAALTEEMQLLGAVFCELSLKVKVFFALHF